MICLICSLAREKMLCLNLPDQEDEPCAWSQCWADGSVWEVDVSIICWSDIIYYKCYIRCIGSMNRTKYFALTILSIVCRFRGMVVKACFQINTEAIGLDWSHTLFQQGRLTRCWRLPKWSRGGIETKLDILREWVKASPHSVTQVAEIRKEIGEIVDAMDPVKDRGIFSTTGHQQVQFCHH